MTWITPSNWWDLAAFGTVPDWLEAVGTSAAFFVAAVAFSHEVRNRRAAQARLVYAAVAYGSDYLAGAEMVLWGNGASLLAWEDPDVRQHDDGFGNPSWTSDTPKIMTLVMIRNESAELIGPVLVLVEGVGVAMREQALGARLVEPGGDTRVQILCSWTNAPEPPLRETAIAFRDSSGTWWKRRGGDPIQRATRDEATTFASLARSRIADL